MIEAIKEIGEYAVDGCLAPKVFLENICLKLPETKPNKKNKDKPFKQHVVILNFDTVNKKIYIDFEQVNAVGKDSGKEYLWVGNFKGNKPQVNITSDGINNILTKSLPLIKEKANGELENCIQQIIHEFFSTKEYSNKKTEIIYYIKPDKFDFSDDTRKVLKEMENELTSAKIKSEVEKSLIKLTGQIEKNILSFIGLDVNEVSLYTVKIDNSLVCKMDEYTNLIFDSKIEALFIDKGRYKDNFQEGICSLCGKEKIFTTSNTTNLQFKFYINDKLGFSSNLDGCFKKNFNICKECYQYLMIAENYIDSRLSTQIGLDAYIIPHFVYKPDNWFIDDFSEYVVATTNSITNIKSLNRFNENLNTFAEFDMNSYLINYLFYHPSEKNDFKIRKLIKDVPPSRLNFIRRKEEEIINLVDCSYNRTKDFKIDLMGIYGCIPIKKKESSGFIRYLDVVDAIFSESQIDYSFLINQFTNVIKIIKFERDDYNIKIDSIFEYKILQLNFLLLFFKKLHVLNGENMNVDNNMISVKVEELYPKEILNYWNDIEIYNDECKKASFLLGFLIGEIANVQSGTGSKKKPILNKINFQGMGIEKLIRLSDDVFEKLRQYGRLQYTENIYSALKMLMDMNISQWKLSNQENVFYVLSGYAFSNYASWQRYLIKTEENIKLVENKIKIAKENGNNVTEQELVLKTAIDLFYGTDKNYKKVNEILEIINISAKESELHG
ncbi:TIGR02556 family CRISPR-associated protein [Methanolobus psychrotolerans]|uniref:TIGR02556 family CRISPR-associated protein n=1 Tax=Methanolobus psychrotolerans TaxID=1874706 RepID=UPI0013EB209D|nr:TIGR02556 family CRISPR-associated protein [Methanolobus psychrotolerans]